MFAGEFCVVHREFSRSLMPNEHPEQNRIMLLMQKHGH